VTWFKVDDGFWSHPKTAALSDAALAMWVRAGAYSCQHLTDGFISPAMLRMLGERGSVDELVEAGLWEVAPGGWQFHDWSEYQETGEAVKRRREQARDRQRRSRVQREKKRLESHSNPPPVTPPVTRDRFVSDATRHEPTDYRRADESETGRPSIVPVQVRGAAADSVTRDITREFSTPDPTVGRVGTTSLPSLPSVADATEELPPRPSATTDRVPARLPQGGREVADRLNATAHSPEAHNIARQYEKHIGSAIPGKVLTDIAQQIDACLTSGVPPEQIGRGLIAWHDSPISATSQIPSFVHKAAAKSRPRGRSKPTNSALDAHQIAEDMIAGGITRE